MNFQQLYCFCATAEQLNFTRAAKHLYIGQPTLSKHISDLEQELGVKLFIRNNRTVKLTDAGMIFLKHANEIIVKITETLEATRQAGSGLVGTLRIGIIDIEKYFLTHLISKYHRIYPNNHISINRYSWIAINEALNHDEVDLAFTFVHGLEMLAGVTWEKLATVPITVILPLSHPLAKKKKIDLSVCANEPFIAVKSALATSIITQLCLNKGFTPKIVSQPLLIDTILMMVEAGLGISVLSRNAHTSPQLQIVNIDDEDAFLDCAVAWKTDNTNPLIPQFLEIIKLAGPP